MNRKNRGFHIGSIVRHFKNPDRFYRIEDFSRHTETGEMLVNYRQMYPPYNLFSRPEAIFCSKVDKDKYPESEQEYRFELVRKESVMKRNRDDAAGNLSADS